MLPLHLGKQRKPSMIFQVRSRIAREAHITQAVCKMLNHYRHTMIYGLRISVVMIALLFCVDMFLGLPKDFEVFSKNRWAKRKEETQTTTFVRRRYLGRELGLDRDGNTVYEFTPIQLGAFGSGWKPDMLFRHPVKEVKLQDVIDRVIGWYDNREDVEYEVYVSEKSCTAWLKKGIFKDKADLEARKNDPIPIIDPNTCAVSYPDDKLDDVIYVKSPVVDEEGGSAEGTQPPSTKCKSQGISLTVISDVKRTSKINCDDDNSNDGETNPPELGSKDELNDTSPPASLDPINEQDPDQGLEPDDLDIADNLPIEPPVGGDEGDNNDKQPPVSVDPMPIVDPIIEDEVKQPENPEKNEPQQEQVSKDKGNSSFWKFAPFLLLPFLMSGEEEK